MPNWCVNNLQLSGTTDQIAKIQRKLDECNGKDFFDIFVPNAEQAGQADGESWYGYNLEKYGCKWNCTAMQWDVDGEGTNITINFDSPWGPPNRLYEELYSNQQLGVLAYYEESGMTFCGRWEDGEDDYYEYGGLSADEIDEQIPDDINGMFSISEYRREWEEQEEDEEDEEQDEEPLTEEDEQLVADKAIALKVVQRLMEEGDQEAADAILRLMVGSKVN